MSGKGEWNETYYLWGHANIKDHMIKMICVKLQIPYSKEEKCVSLSYRKMVQSRFSFKYEYIKITICKSLES